MREDGEMREEGEGGWGNERGGRGRSEGGVREEGEGGGGRREREE